ncbi:MAG: metallophosphoesterase, partial [Alphaproteobacteria bacterium]|nr:metallophosphoesterase [Alphaproteobacteria bacterium]
MAHQFIIYGDSCSGVPNAPHEKTHAKINNIISKLLPTPEFIIFPGDEVIGLTADEAELKKQWQYWLNHEMAWLDTASISLYNSTGNHTTYSPMSERVFAEMFPHLPRNGAPNQDGLSYFIRRDDLLLVFVHTLCGNLGGEGHVETQWLEQTLKQNADAKYKLVIGHHPVFPVNGYAGNYGRTIGAE